MSVASLFPWTITDYSGVERGDYVYGICPLCHREKLFFTLTEKGDGLGLRCWKGCNKVEILRATGRRWKDCYLGEAPSRPQNQEVVARYPYTTKDGTLLYIKDRLEPGYNGASKSFRVKRPLPDGRWACGLKAGRYEPVKSSKFLRRILPGEDPTPNGVDLPDSPRVLYNLPLLYQHPNRQVLIVGGEKDADSLTRLNLVATTCDRGEGSGWLEEWSLLFTGRHATVVEDDDETGKRFACEVVGSLLQAGAARVRRVKLPGHDATAYINWLRQRGVQDRAQLRSYVVSEISKGKSWQPV